MIPSKRGCDQFCQVQHIHFLFFVLDSVGKHGVAKWAGDSSHPRFRGNGFLSTLHIHPLEAFFFFLEHLCPACAAGRINLCERAAFGHLEPGLQTGFCTDTGGGWSNEMLAHPLQVVDIPDDLSDEDAVLVEPTACAVHAADRYTGEHTALIGAGTIGLLTLAAISRRVELGEVQRRGPIVVTARYPEQRRLAKEFGADIVCAPDELPRWVRSTTSSLVIGDQLTGGAPHVIDCVGSSESVQQALRVVAPAGSVHVVGIPGNV